MSPAPPHRPWGTRTSTYLFHAGTPTIRHATTKVPRLQPSSLLHYLSRVVHKDIAPRIIAVGPEIAAGKSFVRDPKPRPPNEPCGRVCQGPNPSSKLRLYSPSSPHPIRLPMKRQILHPPRPLTPLRNGSLQKLSARCLRSTEPRSPRTQHRRLHHQATITIPFRASCPSAGL